MPRRGLLPLPRDRKVVVAHNDQHKGKEKGKGKGKAKAKDPEVVLEETKEDKLVHNKTGDKDEDKDEIEDFTEENKSRGEDEIEDVAEGDTNDHTEKTRTANKRKRNSLQSSSSRVSEGFLPPPIKRSRSTSSDVLPYNIPSGMTDWLGSPSAPVHTPLPDSSIPALSLRGTPPSALKSLMSDADNIFDKEEAVAKLRILLDKAIARRTEAQEDVDQLISLIKQLM